MLVAQAARQHDIPASLRGQAVFITGAASGLGAALASTLAHAGADIVAGRHPPPGADRRGGAVARSRRARAPDRPRCRRPGGGPPRDRGSGRHHGPARRPGQQCRHRRHPAGRRIVRRRMAARHRHQPERPFSPRQARRGPHAHPGRRHIVNVASTAAKRAWPNAAAYHASKWGLLGLSHALHAELRPQNIRVTAVVAGGMRTPFLLERFPELDPAQLQDPANVAEAIRAVLCMPPETVIAELIVLPMRETSWP